MFATVWPVNASNNHTKHANTFVIGRTTVSVKAALAILWACLIAGAAVASESQRRCELHAHMESHGIHEEITNVENDSGVSTIAEVDVTN